MTDELRELRERLARNERAMLEACETLRLAIQDERKRLNDFATHDLIVKVMLVALMLVIVVMAK